MKSRANGFRKILIALILEATSLKILCEKDREELIELLPGVSMKAAADDCRTIFS